MRFGGYGDEKDTKDRIYVIPSDSYMDVIAENVGAMATMTGFCGGVYYLFRDRANTAFRGRLVNSFTKTPRLAATVAGYALIGASLQCSLVALRGKGDEFNSFAETSVFFGLLARSRGPAFASAAGLLGGAVMHCLDKALIGADKVLDDME